MATQVQFRRGTTAQHSSFTGAAGEITVDTDKEVVVVHDGALVGGYPMKRDHVSATNTILGRSSAGSGVIEEITCTSTARSLLDDSSVSAMRTTLGVAIGTDVQAYDANTAKTNVAQTFSAAQRGGIVTLVDGATITPDFSLGNNFVITISGNRTLANPTNAASGQTGTIIIKQDSTGSRTMSYGNAFKFAGGTAPTLSTASGKTDVLAYFCESSSRINASLIKDLS